MAGAECNGLRAARSPSLEQGDIAFFACVSDSCISHGTCREEAVQTADQTAKSTVLERYLRLPPAAQSRGFPSLSGIAGHGVLPHARSQDPTERQLVGRALQGHREPIS